MNREQLLGLTRHALTVGAGWFIHQGYIDEASSGEVIGAIMTLIGLAWSFLAPEKKTVPSA